MKKNIVIFGSTSAMAFECAKLWAAEGCSLVLLGRRKEVLEHQVQDLKVRGADQCFSFVADLSETQGHKELLAQCVEKLGSIDIALLAYGVLGEQEKEQDDYEQIHGVMQTNFLSPISLLTHLVVQMEKQGQGHLAVITSVAGDRGRQSNYIYGASKGGLSIYIQGLRNRLAKRRIHVLDIRPGFVDTPMTENFPKGPLFVKPDVIAGGILKAIDKKRNIVYLPWFWWGIMSIIKSIPEFIFKKLKL